MDFNQLCEANKAIATTDIKGKDYAEVNQRIKAFRMCFPEGCIATEMLSNENGVCVFKATVTTNTGSILGTGTAYEKEGSTFINKTSYIENCETSAVGRALGMAGFGIDTSVASAEEVQNAIAQQDDDKLNNPISKVKVNALNKKLENEGVDADKVCKLYKVTSLADLTEKHLANINNNFDKVKEKCLK